MYELFCKQCEKRQRNTDSIKFNNREEAEGYAKLLWHFGQNVQLVDGIWEYYPETGYWENMAY